MPVEVGFLPPSNKELENQKEKFRFSRSHGELPVLYHLNSSTEAGDSSVNTDVFIYTKPTTTEVIAVLLNYAVNC